MNSSHHLYKKAPFAKIVLIGDAGVGKTALLRRSTGGVYTPLEATLGVGFYAFSIEVNGKTLKLQIWDTSGVKRLRTITSTFLRDADGCIIVCDATCKDSFWNVKEWISIIKTEASQDVPRLLVVNKCDMAPSYRHVTEEMLRGFAESTGIEFLETSAKNASKVEEAFELMAKKIMLRSASFPEAAAAGSGSGASLGRGKHLDLQVHNNQLASEF